MTSSVGYTSCIPRLWISITGVCNFDFGVLPNDAHGRYGLTWASRSSLTRSDLQLVSYRELCL